jgi:hypothetical protein
MHRQEIHDHLLSLSATWTNANAEADRDYWTNPELTVAKVKAKHKLSKWKPQSVNLTMTCPDCGTEEQIVLQYKKDVVGQGENWKCPNKACPGHEVRMPFGKYRGMTIVEVWRKQPSYLAWFLESVEADCEEVQVVKAEIEKMPGIKWMLEKYHERQLQQQWVGQNHFSPAAIDDLCDKLFNGE